MSNDKHERWNRTPDQEKFVQSFVQEYQRKRLDGGHVDYVRHTIIPLWDQKFGRPTGVANFEEVRE